MVKTIAFSFEIVVRGPSKYTGQKERENAEKRDVGVSELYAHARCSIFYLTRATNNGTLQTGQVP